MAVTQLVLVLVLVQQQRLLSMVTQGSMNHQIELHRKVAAQQDLPKHGCTYTIHFSGDCLAVRPIIHFSGDDLVVSPMVRFSGDGLVVSPMAACL